MLGDEHATAGNNNSSFRDRDACDHKREHEEGNMDPVDNSIDEGGMKLEGTRMTNEENGRTV